jgi:hypothetical protein
MRITTCPNCEMRVIPKADGTCPSCYAVIPPEGTAPAVKVAAAPAKKESKAAARKKPAAKAAQSTPPAAPAAASPDLIYEDYFQTAFAIWRGSLRVFLFPYFLTCVILGVVLIVVSRLTWEEVAHDTMVLQPSSMTWVLLWLGIAVVLVSAMVGVLKADQWAKIQIREIVRTRTGFPDFYKAYRKNYWPKTGMPAGEAYDTFLAVIGNK